jgi:hypothetical protein
MLYRGKVQIIDVHIYPHASPQLARHPLLGGAGGGGRSLLRILCLPYTAVKYIDWASVVRFDFAGHASQPSAKS